MQTYYLPRQTGQTPRQTGIDRNKVGPPQKERSICIEVAVRTECPEAFPTAGKGFDESESDSSLSQSAGAHCKNADPLQEERGFVKSVAKVKLE